MSVNPLKHLTLPALLTAGLLLSGCAAHTPGTVEPVQASTAETCFPVDALPPAHRALADSILTDGLDHEALFSLMDGLKPMSTLRHENHEVARDPELPSGTRAVVPADDAALDRMTKVAEVVRHLHCGPVRTVLVPLRRTPDGIRRVQLLAVHEDTFREVIERDHTFWGQWGLGPETDPATIITVVEFEESGARFRGYGYLFGYPEHAVTFFVEAAREQEETGEFVERDFFQIPTHKAETGRFVYAVPVGHEPRPEDEAIRERALDVLRAYREKRPAFEREDGSLRAVELLRAHHLRSQSGRR